MAWDPFGGTFDPIYCDGFDNYREVLDRWTVGQEAHTAGQPDQHPDFSRHTFGQGLFANGRNVQIELSRSSSAIIVEGAFNWRTVFGLGVQDIAFLKLDVATQGHCAMRLSSSRHPYFTTYNSGTPIAGPAVGPERVVQVNRWYWFSLYAKIHASLGEMVFYVNGDEWLRAEGLNTLNPSASGALIDCVQLSGQFGTSWYIDDVVIQDGETGKFMGDMIVLGKRPIAAGYITQFTPNTGTNHQAVDEVEPDEDTTYVASDVVGERDSYIIEDITEVPDTSVVLGVQQAFRHRKDEPGPRSVFPFIRVGTDEYLGDEYFPSETGYRTSVEPVVHLLQPDGASAWGTVATFNALDVEIGQETGDGSGESS